MIIEELKEVNDAITMMEELSLPISMQKLKERDSLESKYLEEILIPQIKDQIQSLSEQIHKPFCLVVDYQHGLPVQVKIAEKTKLKVDVNRGKVKKVDTNNRTIVFVNKKIVPIKEIYDLIIIEDEQ